MNADKPKYRERERTSACTGEAVRLPASIERFSVSPELMMSQIHRSPELKIRIEFANDLKPGMTRK